MYCLYNNYNNYNINYLTYLLIITRKCSSGLAALPRPPVQLPSAPFIIPFTPFIPCLPCLSRLTSLQIKKLPLPIIDRTTNHHISVAFYGEIQKMGWGDGIDPGFLFAPAPAPASHPYLNHHRGIHMAREKIFLCVRDPTKSQILNAYHPFCMPTATKTALRFRHRPPEYPDLLGPDTSRCSPPWKGPAS